MRIVRERNLDVHDRKRFNELQPTVFADALIEMEFEQLAGVIRIARIENRGVVVDRRTIRASKRMKK